MAMFKIPKAAVILSQFLLFTSSRVLGQVALEPDQAGGDYLIQGEYAANPNSGLAIAAQIVAMGGGQFQAIFYGDGLPGQGWNGKTRTEISGKQTKSNLAAQFSGQGYLASIPQDGLAMDGQLPSGAPFHLIKIHRQSPTLLAKPPVGASVLFDGSGLSAWEKNTASMDTNGYLIPFGSSASAGAITKKAYQSFYLHLEFRIPFMPTARGRSRANSGIYLQGRDEVQILDSFGTDLAIQGQDTMAATDECGAFFEYYAPSLNMSFPPLAWQTFDIEFAAATYDLQGKTKLIPAQASVWLNGVLVQDKKTLNYSTLGGDIQGPEAGPLRFQAYGDPVYYRNIWIFEGPMSLRLKRPKSTSNSPFQPYWNWTRLDGRQFSDAEKAKLRVGRK